MRSLSTHRVAVNPCDSPSSPSGECKDGKLFSDNTPVDDAIQKDDFFDTQVVDYGDDDDDIDNNNENTQRVDFYEETQIMDLAGETQVMDEFDDFFEDTQLLVVSDSETECESDGAGAGQTQVLDDTMELNDILIPDTVEKQPNGGENLNSHRHDVNGEARAESPPSVDVTRRSDSFKRGFASVRTASLRASGLAARKMASKNAGNESCATTFNSESSKCHSVNNDICTGVQDNITKHDENDLVHGRKSDVARTLARKLFIEDVSEGDEDFDHGMAELSQQPGCDNDLAGLSYVDSQEPGELSQANALEFVDRFLKVNLFEPGEDLIRKNAACDTATPGSLRKGANSVARFSNSRSKVASASVYEWDDKVEDEGGGEFFIKKRELLFGNRQVARNPCSKTKTSRRLEPKVSQPPAQSSDEQQQNVSVKGVRHSDSKFMKGKKAGKFDEIDTEKNNENCIDQRSCLDASNQPISDAPSNAELAELVGVGIDTQMAAEAMEALATVSPLLQNISSSEGLNNIFDRDVRGETKNVSKKRSGAQKKPCISNSGAVTRSLRKSVEESEHNIVSRSRPQHVTTEDKADLVKPRAKRTRSSVKHTSIDHNKQSLDRELLNVDGAASENHLVGELHIHTSVAPKRHSSRKKETLLSGQKNTQLIGANEDLGDSREGRQSIEGAHIKKRKTRSNTASLNLNAGVETVNLAITGDKCMPDGSKHKESTGYGACEVAFGSIARRTRSKRVAQSPQCLKDEKGQYSRAIQSTEKAVNSSSVKRVACSPPNNETLADVALDGSCRKKQKSSSPADITPNNLKTPEHAVSPICKGDDYHTPSCKKSLFLRREFYQLIDSEEHYSSPFRVLRQRRDVNNVRVLFSQHLDEDTVRQQKKILSRLGFYEASSILEATHFVVDVFTRTRNMLEAIANAKFIVTHLWLESCGQANSFIDEKNYILRDTKKEKELGFSMPISLARASRQPILEGRRVLLTPNIKPSKDIISSLVKAVHGQAVERLCRSTSNNIKLLDDLLILSCEEDFEICVPLVEKGIAVYSSELLLNGIITQRLEYDRHRLFTSHVKKTRSTLWLKKKGDEVLRVPKSK